MRRGNRKGVYSFAIKHFKNWIEKRNINMQEIENYRRVLSQENISYSTKRSRWAAVMEYCMPCFEIEYFVKEFAWLDYSIPFKGINGRLNYANELEFRTIIESEIVPEKIKIIVQSIAYTGKRITDLIETRETEILHSKDFTIQIKKIFKSKNYLFSTSTGRRYSRCYLSGRIKYYSIKLLNKAYSAESYRFIYKRKTA